MSETISISTAMEEISIKETYHLSRKNIFRKLAIKFKIYTRKKEIYSEKEKNVISIVRKLCSNKKTIINESNLGFMLYNECFEDHVVDVLITSKYVIITNGFYTSDKQYDDKIIKKLNKFCQNRVTLNTNTRIQKMMERENQMLTNIKNHL